MNRSNFGGSEFGVSNGYRSNGFGGGGGDSYKRFGGGGGNSSFGGFGDRGQRNNNSNSFDSSIPPPNWSTMDLKPFEKNFYAESSSIKSRPKETTTNFLRTNNVKVNSHRFLDPILSFNELTLPRAIENKIQDLRYANPTPIQSLCWPTLLSGLNMVGIAQTGSGKTMGFIIPMVMHILNNQRYVRSFDRGDTPGPIGVVLAPTRELALQIQQVANDIGQLVGIKNVAIYGGASKGPQLSSIRRGADIYIATPGRLIDYLRERLVSLNRCTFLVLDEADRMLDMGFEPQIRKIIEQIRPDRLTAMFSATWPKEVRRLAEDFITEAVQINIGAQELRANPNIKQIVEVCLEGDKHMRLKNILNDIMRNRDSKVIVFAETKKRVDSMSKFIQSLGYRCSSIHGDKKQSEREWVLNDFKRQPKAILCATDVAARGLNIEDIKFVINVDYPMLTEDYVHRIGRTARSTNTGTAFTFVTSENARHMPKLIEILRDTNQDISEELMSMTRQFGGSRYGNSMGGRSRYPAKSSNFGGSNNSRFGNGGSYGSNGYQNGGNGYKSGGGSYDNHQSNGGGYEAKKRDFSSMENGYNSSPVKSSDLNGGAKRSRRWDDDWDSNPSSQNGSSSQAKSIANPYANDAPHSHSNGHSNGSMMAPPPLPTGSAPTPAAIMAMIQQAPYSAYYQS